MVGINHELLDWPKNSFGSAVKCYRKTRTNFLANPILQPSHFSGEVETKMGEGTCKTVHVELIDI